MEQVGCLLFFQTVKTYLGQNNTSNRSSSRRWEASETFQSSKSVRDMFFGDLEQRQSAVDAGHGWTCVNRPWLPA